MTDEIEPHVHKEYKVIQKIGLPSFITSRQRTVYNNMESIK